MVEQFRNTAPAVWSLAAVLMMAITPWPENVATTILRLAVVLPLFLFWPGYLMAAIIGLRRNGPALMAFSLGLSLAIHVPVGLFLNGIGRLDRHGWIGTIAVITIAAWLADALLSRGRQPKERAAPTGALKGAAGFAGAAALAFAAIFIARDGAQLQRQFDYTEFWMVPAPTQDLMTLGVNNGEGVTTGYRIDILQGGEMIAQLPRFSLSPGETRTFPFSVPPLPTKGGRVEAWLYKDDARDVIYRKVWVSPVTYRSPGDEKG